MDRKKLHEEFVTGFSGGPISDIYAAILCCVLAILTSHFVVQNVHGNTFAMRVADFAFNWACTLGCVTIYSSRHTVLAGILLVVAFIAYVSSERPGTLSKQRKDQKLIRKKEKERKKRGTKGPKVNAETTPQHKEPSDGDAPRASESPVAYRDFLTAYRSAMMVLTVTSILAVDFPVFPRRFAKAETWGTSLMDLGVGSFVFSMGVVSARQTILYPESSWKHDVRKSISETANLFILGSVRLFLVKIMDYHEHVTEYGVHWNFFFTLGCLPPLFSILKRIPGRSILLAAILTAVGYEILLKNTGLLEWVLTAPRTDLVSKNKEGLCSFIGYLSIFMFGNAFGLRILPKNVLIKDIIKTGFKWTVLFHLALHVLTISTDPSRRLANLPYIIWVVAFNSGLLFVLALLEYLFDLRPSSSYVAVNRYGNTVFVLGNVLTGVVNLCINTIHTTRVSGVAILLVYQLAMMLASEFLNRRRGVQV